VRAEMRAKMWAKEFSFGSGLGLSLFSVLRSPTGASGFESAKTSFDLSQPCIFDDSFRVLGSQEPHFRVTYERGGLGAEGLKKSVLFVHCHLPALF